MKQICHFERSVAMTANGCRYVLVAEFETQTYQNTMNYEQ